MAFQLSEQEMQVLLPLLEQRISEYYSEIRRAMSTELRQQLKSRKLVLADVHKRLAAGVSRLTLTREQTRALSDIVQRALRDLPSELHHTDTSSMRQELRARKENLEQVMIKLERARRDAVKEEFYCSEP